MVASSEQMESPEQLTDEISGRSWDTPLLIGALLLAGGMLAYFFLGKDSAVVESPTAAIVEETPEEVQIQAVIATEAVSDELLSRARLAAQSGMLVEPSGSNALYFYSVYVEQNPDDATAAAEFETIAADVGQLVAEATGARDWRRASFLVEQLTVAGAGISAAEAYRSDLESYRTSQSEAALSAARAGDETRANSILEELSALPRAESAQLLETRSAVRDALVAFRVEQQAAAEAAAAAARRRAQQQRAAAATTSTSSGGSTTASRPSSAPVQAGPDPLQPVRDAVAAGQFTGSSGAIALLDSVPSGAAGREQLAGEVASALGTAISNNADSGEPVAAERLLNQLAQIDAPLAQSLQAVVDRAYIEQAVAETVSAATLRRVQAAAPVYPRSAVRRNLSGRLKVEFTVDVDGSTRDIEVVESAAGGVFDRSAVRAVSDWRYEPREVRGQLVAQRVYAYLDYSLE